MAATTELSLANAQHETNEARAGLAELETRVDAGDLRVEVGDLAVARERLDLATRRLCAVERREDERREAELIEARYDARDRMLVAYRVGRSDVAAVLEDARKALVDLVGAADAHNRGITAGWRELRELGAPEDVTMLGPGDAFLATIGAEKIHRAPLPQILVALLLDVLDGAAVLGPSSPERAALATTAEWPAGVTDREAARSLLLRTFGV
jgi:hypothetical protein